MSEVQFMLDWLHDNGINPDDYFHNILPWYNPSTIIFLRPEQVKSAMDGGNKAINKLCERFCLTKEYRKPSNSNLSGKINLYPIPLEELENQYTKEPSAINAILNQRISELKKPRIRWIVVSSKKNLKEALSNAMCSDYSITYVWGKWFVKKMDIRVNEVFKLSDDLKQALLNPLVDETEILPNWYIINSKKVIGDD